MSKEKNEPPLPSGEQRPRSYGWVVAFLGVAAATWLGGPKIWAQGGEVNPPALLKQELTYWPFLAIGLLVLAKFVFSLAELAFSSLRITRVKQMLEERQKGAERLNRLLHNPRRLLATAQVGVEIVSAFAYVLAIVGLLAPVSRLVGSVPGALILITLTVAFLNITIGEAIPKGLGALHPERWALRLAIAMEWVSRILLLPVLIVTGVSEFLARRLGGRAHFAAPVITEEELKVLVDSSEEHGVLEEDETEIIRSVFEFTDTIAREVMTPRIDIEAISITASVQEVVKLISETGYSRIPVYRETIDDIVGIIHAKDILARLNVIDSSFAISEVIRPAFSIPENKSLGDLLREMRGSRTQIAIVRDEYGGTAGVVTIEDVVEELVGDIIDEYDEEETMVHNVQDDVFLVDGRMHLDDVNEQLNLDLESDEFDTIGGLVFGLFGHQPEPGEQIEYNDLVMTVHQTDGRRIQKVRIERVKQPTETREAQEA